MRASTAAFFIGVTSTGIYCRPVCRVRTPRRENCRFFRHAAQAESAGFRPCLRCRPELAPHSVVWSIQDASYILAHQAARLLDDPEAWGDAAPSMEQLAARLGVSDRHVRRIFEAQFGVSPLQYLQTRRLLAAKQLLADTDLPITQVALVSGYASVRRFNAAFLAALRAEPDAAAARGRGAAGAGHWPFAWATGRPTTCRPCSAFSPSGRSVGRRVRRHRARRDCDRPHPCPIESGGQAA